MAGSFGRCHALKCDKIEDGYKTILFDPDLMGIAGSIVTKTPIEIGTKFMWVYDPLTGTTIQSV